MFYSGEKEWEVATSPNTARRSKSTSWIRVCAMIHSHCLFANIWVGTYCRPHNFCFSWVGLYCEDGTTTCCYFRALSFLHTFFNICGLGLINICWLDSWKIVVQLFLPRGNHIAAPTLLPLSWSSSRCSSRDSFGWAVFLEVAWD